MAGKIKHMETRIITTFGVEDDYGNIANVYVVQADQNNPHDPLLLRVLSEESLAKALEGLRECRLRLEEKHK